MERGTAMGRTSRGIEARVWFMAGAAALVLVLVACEHARYWRGAKPYPEKFLQEMSDPASARAELDRRLGQKPEEQTKEEATARSAGCMSCHGPTDDPDMHAGVELALSCVDCHGGDATVMSPMSEPGRPGEPGTPIEDENYLKAMQAAHVAPRNPSAWYGSPKVHYGDHADEKDAGRLHGSRTPEATAALLNQESPEFIRFVNPGDLRVAVYSCGGCHPREVAYVRHSPMAHGAQLWGAALYNNGSIPNKLPRYGESYSAFGIPERLQGVIEFDGDEMKVREPTVSEVKREGVVPFLEPLPVWNIAQPGNVLRIFERGTKLPVPGGPVPNTTPAEIGTPNPLAEGGRPDKGLSPRGLGTLLRVDPVFLGLQKTRLLDPTLNFHGTNDHPGDYRASGCTACHTIYANDRDPVHSGAWAELGNDGRSHSVDPTLPKNESGHPARHVLTNAIPSSQCVVCHIHPGTQYANTYLGYMWWDNESDGEFMYPNRTARPTAEQVWESLRKNPDDSATRGLWGNLYPAAVSHAGERSGKDFLERTGEPRNGEKEVFNDRLRHNQFADFHGHGWMFRAVHKKDRTGNLLDINGHIIDPNDPDKWAKAVHLRDLHLDAGMHCVDCHFEQDVHGNGKLYGEVRNAIEITCIDCHGTYTKKATLRTSGPAAKRNAKGEVEGTDLSRSRVGPKKQRRFEWKDGKLFQRSALDPDKVWEVVQTVDTINPESEWAKRPENVEAARMSRYAKTVQAGNVWGDMPADPAMLAHDEASVECYTCHTSWMTSCFGCHLPMRANERTPMLHNENLYARNYTRYNFQVLRDDVYMLGRDSTVKGGKIVPVRSSSAVVVSSQNANREWIYSQQQTVSAEGYSGHPMNPHFPHATGGRGTTKMCTDCHVSSANDNNAWLAQLFTQGTNFVNFMGRYVYVAEGSAGIEAVAVTERDEPQAVYGSRLHELAYPDEFAEFVKGGRELRESYHHDGKGALGWLGDGEILDVQHRGEYLYAARGSAGFYVFDIANIDNKGFSERFVTAPVSPLGGQKLGFDTSYATCIASPSTLAVDPARRRLSNDPAQPPAIGLDPPQPWHVNEEQQIHPLYAYLYIGDRDEGLILTFAGTLLDGDPTNNFLERATLADGSTAFNPQGLLTGTRALHIAGHHLYAASDAGVVVISIDNPLEPQVLAVLGSDAGIYEARSVGVQFRYGFVTDREGLKVIDVTDPAKARVVPGAHVPLADARRLYVMRTRVLVAAGREGLAIIDITQPEKPALEQMFTGDGALNDCRDVKAGMTNASLFAYVADGKNGLRVINLMGPDTTPQFRGFAPPLRPRIIATRHTHGPALAISEGLDRDRAVDETGHQIQVFGRLGSRPLNMSEVQKMYLSDGQVWTVTNEPPADKERAYTPPAEDAKDEPAQETEETPRRGPRRR